MKTLSYSNVKCTLRVPLILLTVGKIKHENFFVLLLLRLSFPWYITQNCTAYMSDQHIKQLFAIRNFPFFGYSLMRATCKIGKLWLQKCITVSFLYTGIPFCNYIRNSMLYKDILPIKLLLYYQRHLFSWLQLYARYDQWVIFPNKHCNLFSIQLFVHTSTPWTLQDIHVCEHCTLWSTALLSEISIFYVRAGC